MHDASCALVIDGVVVSAAEEERFTRIKHIKGLPVNAIQFCLQKNGLSIRDIDVVCTSWQPWVLGTRVFYAAKSIFTSPNIFLAKLERGAGQIHNEWAELFQLRKLMTRYFGRGTYSIQYIDHHLSHASSVFLCSPYDKSAVLTVDGAGESLTTAFWIGEGKKLKKLKSIRLPHSLGQFYSAITAFLGFKVQSDEYKVMGLAAYGKPVYFDFLNKYFIKFYSNGTFRLNPHFIDYHLARKGVFRKITTRIFGPKRGKDGEITQIHADVAASAQAIIESAFSNMAKALYKMTKTENLCIAGGVAFNCVAVGKLLANSPFKKIFLQPASGDAGGAIGAPLYIEHKGNKSPRTYIFKNVYLGPSYSTSECEKIIMDKELSFTAYSNENELLKKTAALISTGKLVCWFQGSMEWGPRALGARSLLADPRNPDMKEIINKKVKQREQFRPFAPSILAEKAPDFFEYYHNSPFMNFTFPVKSTIAKTVPAIVHVDNTSRPQAVFKETNPKYWGLIKEFEVLTGIPAILNTSFNVQEPIVCTPQEAINTFLKTTVDYLVLENFIVKNQTI